MIPSERGGGNEPSDGDPCLDRAIANIATFIHELDMKDPSVSVTMRSPGHDGMGRYSFDLHRGIRTVDVDMPGRPLDEVRCTEDFVRPGCPRLYVDGNSWWWCYALDMARTVLADHDGAVEQRRAKSARAAEAELDRSPRCAACGGVRSLETKTGGALWDVRCYTCDPKIETFRETTSGVVCGHDGWPRATHYLVRRQHMPPEVPGHENPMHPDALCGASVWRDGGTSSCRLRSRHEGRCEPYWKEIQRTLVVVDP